MSKEDARDVARIIVGLERLARLASAVPDEVLAAWLVYDAGLSKTHAKKVADSIHRLLRVLGKREEVEG